MEIHQHPDLQKYVQECPAGTIILSEGDQANADSDREVALRPQDVG